ncbi:MAG: hypothetical protein WC428_00505 [Candidatus Paceibacterota bacterium]
MAIILNDNIKINAGKPSESRYLSTGNTAYISVAQANLQLPIPIRYSGLTVNILGIEYWYNGGVADINLIEKKYDSIIPSGDFVTGATNVGFFSGKTGVQILPLNHVSLNAYDGDYYSLYNYYYRGTDGKIHVGTPSDGILKRGYVKTASPVKSWIWNEYTGSGNLLGWILIDGNIAEQIGTFQNGVAYYPPAIPYIQTSWITGTNPNNGSDIVVDTILGSLTTGTTITIGGGVFAKKEGKILDFKTIQSITPNIISVTSDEAFVYLSGATVKGINIGTGVGIYSGVTNNTLQFKSICGGGDTVVSQVGNNIVISSTGGTGGGTYDLSSPSVCPVGGICAGTILTGKTAFQLFEEILVPEIFGTLTAPIGSISTTAVSPYEIGCSASFNVIGAFNRGCINPQGCSTSDKRVGLPSCYIYTGAQIGAAYASSALTDTRSIAGYTVIGGSQTWSVQTCYGAGVQPISTKGTVFNSACPAGMTPSASVSITGILPWYWGKSASGIVNGACVAAGTKIVASASGTLPITYNSASTDYLWFAVPAGTPVKTCWYVNGTNNGCIGGVGNLFAASCSVTVTSGSGCWIGCNFMVYVSCAPTGTAVGVPMCMS